MKPVGHTSRRCGGTQARPGFRVDDDVLENKTWVSADKAELGCGHLVVAIGIPPTAFLPSAGHRPLFSKPAPAIVCPRCDAPGPLIGPPIS